MGRISAFFISTPKGPMSCIQSKSTASLYHLTFCRHDKRLSGILVPLSSIPCMLRVVEICLAAPKFQTGHEVHPIGRIQSLWGNTPMLPISRCRVSVEPWFRSSVFCLQHAFFWAACVPSPLFRSFDALLEQLTCFLTRQTLKQGPTSLNPRRADNTPTTLNPTLYSSQAQ